MFGKPTFTSIISFSITCLFCIPAFADLDPQEMYDDFNTKKINGCTKCIDTSKWSGQERGDYVGEVERKIKGNRAFFKIKSWGDAESDDRRQNGRNRLVFKNDPGSITGACFTPKVTKYINKTCSSDMDDYSRVQIRYIGHLYDTNAPDDGANGVVMVNFSFKHDTFDDEFGSLKKSEFVVYGGAWQCGGEDCSSEPWSTGDPGAGFTSPDLYFGKFKKSNKTEFCVGYDAATHELVFSADGDERRVNAAEHNLPAFAFAVDPDEAFHAIEARVDVQNCQTDGQLFGHLEGTVDNVKVYRRP